MQSRIVLIAPTQSGNVGSVCRVLMNFGYSFKDLYIVNPQCDYQDLQSQGFAGHARSWLPQLQIVSQLSDAIEGCHRVIGTTAITQKIRLQSSFTPWEIVQKYRETDLKTAILFGSEHHGLSKEDLTSCDELLHIPVAMDYPALNLAMSVGITAYALRSATLNGFVQEKKSSKDLPVETVLVNKIFNQWLRVCDQIGFINPQKPQYLRMGLRRLLGRVLLSNAEARWVTGFLDQWNKFLHSKKPSSTGQIGEGFSSTGGVSGGTGTG